MHQCLTWAGSGGGASSGSNGAAVGVAFGIGGSDGSRSQVYLAWALAVLLLMASHMHLIHKLARLLKVANPVTAAAAVSGSTAAAGTSSPAALAEVPQRTKNLPSAKI